MGEAEYKKYKIYFYTYRYKYTYIHNLIILLYYSNDQLENIILKTLYPQE